MTAEPTGPIRLTQYAKRAGCAAKHPPGFLLPLLGMLPPITSAAVMVGSSTADDAAVYKLNDDRALVFTTDFFTPIVDDPRDFGRIAAANAISDIYAMGGYPLMALSIVGFPDTLPREVLGEILLGAHEVAQKAGCSIVGGHTIKTDEPIFGLAVVGEMSPDRVWANSGASEGNVLILTKPLGLGVITTAAKNGKDDRGAITEAIRVMTTLNGPAVGALRQFQNEINVRAATDITGFGLLGHLRNMTSASGVDAEITASAVPMLEAAREYAAAGIVPGGTRANALFLRDWVTFADSVDEVDRILLCDAQTSGGLLVAVPAFLADDAVARLVAAGTPAAAKVGRITGPGRGSITVV